MKRATPKGLSHEQQSERTATAFCESISHHFGSSAKVRDVEPQGGAVDAIVEIDGNLIYVEFLSYRQRDEFHELEGVDASIREKTRNSLTACGLSLIVRIEWKTEPRRKKDSSDHGFRAKLPRGEAKEDEFVAELARLAQVACHDPTLLKKRIAFGNSFVDPLWRWMPCADFPLLACYCHHVTFESSERGGTPYVTTSASFRDMSLDGAHLCGKLSDKRNRLGRYRKAAGMNPLWLVIYADGGTLSTHVHAGVEHELIGVIEKELKDAPDSFDKIWWMKDVGRISAPAELVKVCY